MSIIQDALRKAQDGYGGAKMPQSGEVFEYVKPPVEIVKPKVKADYFPLLASVFAILLLFYAAGLSLGYFKTREKNLNISGKAGAAVSKQENSVSPANKASSSPALPKIDHAITSPAKFVLNGIMYVENKPQAIINGHVLEEGDKINDATVLVIENDCVLLDLNNTDIKLEISR